MGLIKFIVYNFILRLSFESFNFLKTRDENPFKHLLKHTSK